MTQLHQKKRSMESMSDEYETPKELFEYLTIKYDLSPLLDVCATQRNKVTAFFYNSSDDGLYQIWKQDVWCNPPHSLTGKFVEKAYNEWCENNINIMMIIPANTMSSKYWHKYIEDEAEYHPIEGRIRFLVDGKPSKHMSRNAYVCVIWRKNG